MQSLFYNQVLTSTCNSLNITFKVGKQDWGYKSRSGSVPPEGQKVMMLNNYKANGTARNDCTFMYQVLASTGMGGHKGRNFCQMRPQLSPASQNSS